MDMIARKKMVMMQGVGLPLVYQRVDYIESTGTQYIVGNISGVTADSDIEIDIYSFNYSGDGGFFALYNPSNNQRAFFTGYGFQNCIYIAAYNKQTYYAVERTAIEGDHVIRKIDNNLFVDGTLSGSTGTALPSMTDYTNVNLFIVGKTLPTNVALHSRYKHVTVGNVLNLIPCVRKSDSKPGMYDTVSKTFYTNAGTGEFIVPA